MISFNSTGTAGTIGGEKTILSDHETSYWCKNTKFVSQCVSVAKIHGTLIYVLIVRQDLDQTQRLHYFLIFNLFFYRATWRSTITIGCWNWKLIPRVAQKGQQTMRDLYPVVKGLILLLLLSYRYGIVYNCLFISLTSSMYLWWVINNPTIRIVKFLDLR